MDGSPSSVLTMGLGAWGSVNLLPTLGFGSLIVDTPTGIPALSKSIASGIGLSRVLNPGPGMATSIYSGIGLAKVRNV